MLLPFSFPVKTEDYFDARSLEHVRNHLASVIDTTHLNVVPGSPHNHVTFHSTVSSLKNAKMFPQSSF